MLPKLSVVFFTLLSLLSYSQDKPNVIIIMTDQQFADAMSFRMGNKWLKTPAMDMLARSGKVFTRAYASTPLCVPSRNAIITGKHPHQTGIVANKYNAIINDDVLPSMGKYFKNAGYETAYYGKWHLAYPKKESSKNGFDETDVLFDNGHDNEVEAAANKFLDKPHQKPFLLFISFTNPHDVCELARDGSLPGGAIAQPSSASELPPLKFNSAPSQNEPDAISLIRKSYHGAKMFPVGNYSSEQWRSLIWGYYRLIEKVDSLIGKVLLNIKRNKLDENTLIVFTSDHGESMGSHGFNQKTLFYEESSRVPFIISYPGKVKPGLSDYLINTGTDILPTILNFAGIHSPADLPGKNLRTILENKKDDAPRAYIVSENYLEQGAAVNGVIPRVKGRMIRSDAFKYCLYDTGMQREELFDLKKDPGEKVNLAYHKSMKQILSQHQDYLRDHAKKYSDTTAMDMLRFVYKPEK